MKEYSLSLQNGNVCFTIVRDCLSVIVDSKSNNTENLCHDAHNFGKSVVFRGSKQRCIQKMKKLKEYVKFKKNHPKSSEYSIVLNKLMTIESTTLDSQEIQSFISVMNNQKKDLLKYIKTLGVDSFKIDDGKFDDINDMLILGMLSDELIKSLSKKSEYSVQEIQKRIIELNKSGVLNCFETMTEILIK